MAINFRANSGATGSATQVNTLGITVPAAARDGDLLVMVILVVTGTAQTFTGLTGWTQQKNLNVNSPVLAIYTKVCNGDAGTTVNPAWGTTAYAQVAMFAYSGVDATNPIDTSNTTNGSTSPLQYGSVVAPINNMVLAIMASSIGNTISAPTLFTQRYDSGDGPRSRLALAERLMSAGSTGSVTSTQSSATTYQSCLLALRPAQVPTFREAGTAAAATNTTLSPAQPASTQIGDLLIAICAGNTSTVWNTPAGWTLAGTQANGQAVFYRFAAAAGSGTTHTFTISTASNAISARIVAYSGVGSVDATGATSFAGVTAMPSPSLTSLVANSLYVAAGSYAATGGAITPPAGMTEQYEAANNERAYVADEPVPVAGTVTGTRAIAGSVVETGNMAALILAPPQNVPTLIGVAKNRVTTGTSLSVPLPPNVAGDLMVMTVAWATVISSIVAPAGWTEIRSDLTGTNGQWFKAYTKVSSGSESDPSASWTTSASATATVSVVRGGRFDVDGLTINASSTTVNWPSLTPVGIADLLLFIESNDGNFAMTAFPAPVTVLNDGNGAATANGIFYEVVNGAVATGARTGTISTSSADHSGYVIAIAPKKPAVQMIV